MHLATGHIASHAALSAALASSGASPAEVEEQIVPIDEKNLPAHCALELATTGKTKTGRNEPCPCGSGRKFKRCHYTDSREAQVALLGMKLAADAIELREVKEASA